MGHGSSEVGVDRRGRRGRAGRRENRNAWVGSLPLPATSGTHRLVITDAELLSRQVGTTVAEEPTTLYVETIPLAPHNPTEPPADPFLIEGFAASPGVESVRTPLDVLRPVVPPDRGFLCCATGPD
jgi:hypothetical protein